MCPRPRPSKLKGSCVQLQVVEGFTNTNVLSPAQKKWVTVYQFSKTVMIPVLFRGGLSWIYPLAQDASNHQE